MTNQTKTTMRRLFSLSVFSALVAAVTMAFAQAPTPRTELHFDKLEPALRVTPSKAMRLAEAPSRARSTAKPASASSENPTKPALTGTININTATESDLVKLPGVGPKKATTIVQWREKNGRFDRVIDLRRVKGFGAKSVKKLMPYLSIKGPHTLH